MSLSQLTADIEYDAESWIDIVARKAAAMRFGSVQIIVHDGRVTQVETTEKTRLADVIVTPPAKKK